MSDLLTTNSPDMIHTLFGALGQLGHDGIVTLLAGGLVVAGLVAIVVLGGCSLGLIRQIWRGIADVELSQGEQQFARHFADISMRVEAMPVLREPWGRFKATLVLPRDVAVTGATIKCTSAPAAYFCAAALKPHLQAFRALPGLFLTLTLLLTVAGIVGSMSAALQSVDDSQLFAGGAAVTSTASAPSASAATAGEIRQQGASPERMQMALRRLLDAGGATFSVAVAGLLISLLMTAALAICSSALNSSIQMFAAVLTQRIELISFEATVLERLASGAAEPRGARTGGEVSHNVESAIQQALPEHLDAAMAKLQAVLERQAATAADASSTAMRGLAQELRELLDDRVYEPVQGMNEQMIRLRGQLLGMIDVVGASSPPGASASTSGDAGQLAGARLQPELAEYLQALQHSHRQLAGDNEATLRELLDDVTCRLEANLAGPMHGVSTDLADLRTKLAAIETSLARPRPVEADAVGRTHDADIRGEISMLVASLERSNVETAASSQAAIENVLGRYFEQIDAGVAASLSGVGDTIDDVRAKLAVLEAASARQELASADVADVDLADDLERTRAEIVTLRQSLDEAASRITAANQAAIDNLTDALVGRLEGLDQPQQHLAEGLADIKGRLAGFEKPLFALARVQSTSLSASDHAAHFDHLRATLLESITQGNDKVSDFSLQLANALAEDIAARLENNVTAPMQGLADTLRQLKQTLEDQRLEIAEPGLDAANDVTVAAADVRLAAADMRSSIAALTSQAQAECDTARTALIAQINQSIQILGDATQHFETSGDSIAAELEQVIKAAPETLAREAEAAARTVNEATDAARLRLEATVAAMSEANSRDNAVTTEALTRISEQLVRQSVHARDVLNEQLTNTVSSIERAMSAITLAFDGLNGNVAQGTQAATKDILAQLAVATAELSAVARRSNEDTIQSVAGIWQAASQARVMIASDLERIREQILLQAEQVNADSAARLRETAAEVASMMAGYGGDLSTVTGTLVETLQTLSVEMRRLEPRLVHQGSGQAGYQQARTGSANASAQGSEHDVVEDDSAEAMLSRFVANRRASVNMN